MPLLLFERLARLCVSPPADAAPPVLEKIIRAVMVPAAEAAEGDDAVSVRAVPVPGRGENLDP